MITSDQLKDVMEHAEALRRYLSIDQRKVEFKEEQLRTQAPDFWEDPKRVQEQMIRVKGTGKRLVGYQQVRQLADELELTFNFYHDEVTTEDELDTDYTETVTAIEHLEVEDILRQAEDPMDCVMKINSGAGGAESQDWAQALMRMYMRWAEAHDYRCTISDIQDGDEADIKNVTVKIEDGEYAYGRLKSESRVHRLMHVSPFNVQGKCMTSFTSVFVSPLASDTIEVFVNPARVSWDTFRSSGAGGQNVNKMESSVRLHYQYEDPDTGEEEEILIENTETCGQPKNRAKIMQLLESRFYDRAVKKRLEAQTKIEAGKKKTGWESQIQSYVFDGRRVKDHRTNYQTADVGVMMDGKLDEFIKAYLMEFPVADESD